VAKLNSKHILTEMLLAYESYAAPLIFLGVQIYQDEMLARHHSCG